MPTKKSATQANQSTLALESNLDNVKESLEQAVIEQGTGYELTNYASTANGNKIVKLSNGNYREVNQYDQLVGSEYPEQMFQFALSSGFLVEASLLKGTAKIAEKPKHQYKLSFVESVDLTFEDPLSDELIELLEKCDGWKEAKAVLGGLNYQADMAPIETKISKLGDKKASKLGNGESKQMTNDQKVKVAKNNLLHCLADEPDLGDRLFKGMPIQAIKDLQNKYSNTKTKHSWRCLPSYLNYLNGASIPVGFIKHVDQGIYETEQIIDHAYLASI